MERVIGFLIVVTIIALLYYYGDKALKQKRRPAYSSKIEYWIYGTQQSLPHYDAFKRQLAKDVAAGTAPEEVLEDLAKFFSDGRLAITIVLRVKNPQFFDPARIPAIADRTEYFLEGSATPTSFIRVAFVEYTAAERRAILRLIPYMTRTLANMTRTNYVYDIETEQMLSVEEFNNLFPDPPRELWWDMHVDMNEEFDGDGTTTIRLKGMRKYGTENLSCSYLQDTQTVVDTCIDKFLDRLTTTDADPNEPMIIEEFGNNFVVQIEPQADGDDCLRVFRQGNQGSYI